MSIYVILFLWALGLGLFIYIEFGLVYFIISCFFFIFYNTSERKDGLSAFSVFNKNFERIPGTFSTDDFERFIGRRNDNNINQQRSNTIESSLNVEKPRKIGRNEKCYCGSGIKYKKCCERINHDDYDDDDDDLLSSDEI